MPTNCLDYFLKATFSLLYKLSLFNLNERFLKYLQNKQNQERYNKRESGFFSSPFLLASFLAIYLSIYLFGCAVFTLRPIQEMSDTNAALRAAKEVQADLLAPELFRLANEWYFKARNEYQLKNFAIAKDFANKARMFAETAEFESIRNGGNRTSTEWGSSADIPPPPPDYSPPPPPPMEDTVAQPINNAPTPEAPPEF